MSRHVPFLVPVGWRTRRHGDVVVATGPPTVVARLDWRPGPAPAYSPDAVEDEDTVDLAGRDVDYRRIGHRRDGVELISEEWTWWVDDLPWVLTGTVPRVDYPTVCDLFEDVAATVELDLSQ